MKNKRGNKVLIDFNAAIDFSYGIFKYMITSRKFNHKYFKPNMIKASDAYYINSIIALKERNPLKLLLLDEYSDSADNMYKELCTSYESTVLKYSRPTDVLKLSYTWKKCKELEIDCVINCKSTIEYDHIKRIVTSEYPITLDNYDATDYDEIIIRDIYDLKRYKNLEQPHLCIYLLNIGVNYKDDGKLKDEAYSYFPALPKTIDMYSGFGYCLPPLTGEEEDTNA
jgi:hypothetical protein